MSSEPSGLPPVSPDRGPATSFFHFGGDRARALQRLTPHSHAPGPSPPPRSELHCDVRLLAGGARFEENGPAEHQVRPETFTDHCQVSASGASTGRHCSPECLSAAKKSAWSGGQLRCATGCIARRSPASRWQVSAAQCTSSLGGHRRAAVSVQAGSGLCSRRTESPAGARRCAVRQESRRSGRKKSLRR